MRAFLQKNAAIAVLGVLLLIALGEIRGVIGERQARQTQVEANIAATAAGVQTLTGPVLVVPYSERIASVEADPEGKPRTVTRTVQRQAVFTPETLDIDGEAQVTPRRRGLYQALLYLFKGRATARFQVPANLGIDPATRDITPGRAHLSLGLTDVRGLQAPPVLRWDGRVLAAQQGSGLNTLAAGVRAEVGPLALDQARQYDLAMEIDLVGMNSLSFAPVGQSTIVKLASDWAHPSSIGRFLPRAKTPSEGYFPASWSVSHLSTNAAAALRIDASPQGTPADTFGVAFIEPVNIYTQSERAVKYGVLFIALTFAAFLLFELLKSLRIHPLQYGFVGLALTLFFLLLVSLSEHIAFAAAYAASATACVALITYYVAHVLRGWNRALFFGAQLAALYAALYGLLRSEDNALVMGSLLLFGLLAAVMVVTRKVDWHALTARSAEAPASAD